MPVYNVEKYIVQAIECILNQTYSNFELLICDDGSQDRTVEIIESYSDSRIKLFKNKANRGNLKTTNFLLQQCKGDFITIQDGDDYSVSNRFEIILNAFEKHPAIGMIGSNYMAVTFDDEPLFCGNLPLN